MEHGRGRRHLISTVGAVAALLLAGLTLVSLWPGALVALGGPKSLLGWAIPLTLLFLVVAITWFVIAIDSKEIADESAHFVACWSCGHSIQEQWRMCPFCGAEMRPAAPTDATLIRS